MVRRGRARFIVRRNDMLGCVDINYICKSEDELRVEDMI